MHPSTWARLLSGLVILLGPQTSAHADVDQPPPSSLIVRVRPGVTPTFDGLGFTGTDVTARQVEDCRRLLESSLVAGVRRVLHAQDRELAARIGLDRYYAVDVPGDPAIIVAALSGLDQLFEVVEVDRPVRATLRAEQPQDAAVFRTNDPLFDQQWALRNTGQQIRQVWGTPGADVGALEAWQYTTGKSEIVVAVLDSGISLSHPDLAGQLVEGINLTSSDTADIDDPWVSHGTHVAGIIAARQGNAEGITGLAPGCRLMPVKVINRFNWSIEQWLAQGVVWAADNGASVMNISMGFPSAGAMQRDAIRYAFERDVVICASSGNIATDPIGFPAQLPETIAVGGTDNRDELAGFTSTGPALTMVAPGRDIISTWDVSSLPNTYYMLSGTSFATPYVAGAAALIRSVNPDLSATQVRNILTESSRDLGAPGWDDLFGWGRLDVPAALRRALGLTDPDEFPCRSDLNGDGSVGFTDLQLFLNAFALRLPEGDWNNDGAYTFQDVVLYLEAYELGCSPTTYEP